MKKTIAVVDDDQPIVDVVTMLLKDEGYDVLAYNNGELLLRDIEREEIHLILLDYRLPKKNGAEIARDLKEKRDIPVILISANHNLDQVVHNMPVDEFIPKPFEIDQLMRKIHSLL